jgi:hypothetical protein
MKPSLKLSIVFLCTLFFAVSLDAQLIKSAKKLINTGSTGFSESEAADAIKEALVKGTSESVSLVSQLDGYFGNKEIKIPLPPEAKNMESQLRSMGLGDQVDKAILSINRAAEDAATEAKKIFIDAIKGLSIQDAINIVKGEDNAATKYLQKTTTAALKAKFKPIIKNSLDKTSATKYWADLVNTYNKIPLVKKVNPDLPAYVTDKAIEGLFIMIAKEELKIRKDPVARTTDLLKKVFGR